MALVHYEDQWRAFVTAGMNFIFHEMGEISLNKWIFLFKGGRIDRAKEQIACEELHDWYSSPVLSRW